MTHVIVPTASLNISLTRELEAVDQKIVRLSTYRKALQILIELHREVNAGAGDPVPGPRRLRAVGRVVPVEPAVDVDAAVDPATPLPDDIPLTDDAPSTLEMARTVLRNAGDTMNLPTLRDAIRATYGIDPAKTLDQMLYKRAQRNKGFYKTPDGEFGLVDEPQNPVAILTPVAVPTTALA